MILCFSGTGNSRYVADMLAESLGDMVLDLAPAVSDFVAEWGAYPSMNKRFSAEGSGSRSGATFVSDDGEPFVLVCPVYGWRIPESVGGVIECANFIGSDLLYVVATYGDDQANAGFYCAQMAEKAGLRFGGFTGVLMPCSYSKVKKMPSASRAREIRAAAREHIPQIAEAIRNQGELAFESSGVRAVLKSGAMHRSFRLYEAGSKHFVVSNKCSRCGRCELFCPVGDIKMTEDGIEFGPDCISCYACIHRCPDSAIDVKGHTEANGRYVCPSYREEIEDLAYEDAKRAKKAAREAARAQRTERAQAAKAAADLVAAVAVAHGVDPEEAHRKAEEAAAATIPGKRKGGRLAAKRAAMEAASIAQENGSAAREPFGRK